MMKGEYGRMEEPKALRLTKQYSLCYKQDNGSPTNGQKGNRMKFYMNLSLFEGGAAGAGAAPAAGTGEGGEAAAVVPGTLDDGTVVDNRLAARMEEQARKRRNRGEEPAPVKAMKVESPAEAQPQEAPQPAEEPSLEDQWTEAKKKFHEQYGRDVKAAVDDRFKNQKSATDQLAKLEPALKALARQRGIDENNLDQLAEDILSDDTLFEEEAEQAGMTVEGYRTFKEMEAENQRLHQQEQQEQEQMFLREHFRNLAMQAEELKKTYPDFDLRRELENETFRRLTAPNSGLKVEDAFYAVHHNELAPQAMAYGIQRAQQQMSQTLAANHARPVEGALRNGPAANVVIDPGTLSREERQKLKERARRGETIIF